MVPEYRALADVARTLSTWNDRHFEKGRVLDEAGGNRRGCKSIVRGRARAPIVSRLLFKRIRTGNKEAEQGGVARDGQVERRVDAKIISGGCPTAVSRARQAPPAYKLISLHSTCERNGQTVCMEMDQVRHREMGMSCLTWEFHHTGTGKLVYVLLVVASSGTGSLLTCHQQT